MHHVDLTVIVPVYNGMAHLPETIESILIQRQPCFELLIIDDGSRDGGRTAQYLDALRDPRVRVIHKNNEGLCLTMNLGFREARGDYVARVDQDDLCAPNRFQVQYDYLTANHAVDVVFSHTQKFGAKHIWDNHDKMDSETARHRVSAYDPLRDGSVLHSTMMGKRAALLGVGGYRPAYYPADDYDLALRLAETYSVQLLPDALVMYRFHAAANTYRYFDRMQAASRWATDNARRRRSGLDERSLDEHEASQPLWKRANRRRKDIGRFYVRQAGQYFLDGEYGATIVPLLIGTCVTPFALYGRLSKAAQNVIRSTLAR